MCSPFPPKLRGRSHRVRLAAPCPPTSYPAWRWLLRSQEAGHSWLGGRSSAQERPSPEPGAASSGTDSNLRRGFGESEVLPELRLQGSRLTPEGKDSRGALVPEEQSGRLWADWGPPCSLKKNEYLKICTETPLITAKLSFFCSLFPSLRSVSAKTRPEQFHDHKNVLQLMRSSALCALGARRALSGGMALPPRAQTPPSTEEKLSGSRGH